jgi:L-lactate dehydrogenase complex protein LldG
MSNTSRDTIFSVIRYSLPKQKIEHPQIPAFRSPARSLKAAFEENLKKAGGAAHDIGGASDAEAQLRALHPGAKVVCSAVPEIAGTRRAETVHDPHELADVNVGVVRAQFGVAETGAIWLTQEDLIVDALGFLSQHLVVLLDPEQIVADMHQAYGRIRLDLTAYGCFMMGPRRPRISKPPVVHGAQGCRSLNVFFLPRSQSA